MLDLGGASEWAFGSFVCYSLWGYKPLYPYGQRERFRMETRRYARRPTKPDRALLKRLEDRQTYQLEATTVRS